MLFKRKNFLIPFEQFFKKVTPEIFVSSFQNEMVQTTAFVLSFCKSKKFIQKVLEIINNEEVTEHITLYLSTCKESDFDPNVARSIELYCEKILSYYDEGKMPSVFRNNMSNLLPKNLQKETKALNKVQDAISPMAATINKIFTKFQSVIEKKKELVDLIKSVDELNQEERRLLDFVRRCKTNIHNLKSEMGTTDNPALIEKGIDDLFEMLQEEINRQQSTERSVKYQVPRFDFHNLVKPKKRKG